MRMRRCLKVAMRSLNCGHTVMKMPRCITAAMWSLFMFARWQECDVAMQSLFVVLWRQECNVASTCDHKKWLYGESNATSHSRYCAPTKVIPGNLEATSLQHRILTTVRPTFLTPQYKRYALPYASVAAFINYIALDIFLGSCNFCPEYITHYNQSATVYCQAFQTTKGSTSSDFFTKAG